MVKPPHFGFITRDEIMEAVEDDQWQDFRISLKGLSTETKIRKLWEWVESHDTSREAQVQVTNYVNALRRGGQLK